ncbi:MAG: alpha/beta fold hydrolase [Rhizobacter sp.]|nr:alpha/beta fold hydrolase [Rhizobacter sp.]
MNAALHLPPHAAPSPRLRWPVKRDRRRAPREAALLGAQAATDIGFPARDGRARVVGTLLPAAGFDAAVVLVVGPAGCWGSDARVEGRALHVRTLAQALRARGITVLVTRLRGQAESERHDVLGAVDHLLAMGFQPGCIGVIGASMGASAALLAAMEEPAIGAIVADSPRIGPRLLVRRVIDVMAPALRFMGRVLSGVDLGRRPLLGDWRALRRRPVLLVHGQGDRAVPPEMSRRLAEATGATLWLTASRSHAGTLHEALPLYITRVVDHFSQHLPVQAREPLLVAPAA